MQENMKHKSLLQLPLIPVYCHIGHFHGAKFMVKSGHGMVYKTFCNNILQPAYSLFWGFF